MHPDAEAKDTFTFLGGAPALPEANLGLLPSFPWLLMASCLQAMVGVLRGVLCWFGSFLHLCTTKLSPKLVPIVGLPYNAIDASCCIIQRSVRFYKASRHGLVVKWLFIPIVMRYSLVALLVG